MSFTRGEIKSRIESQAFDPYKYTIPESGKELTAVGLSLGPAKNKLEKILKILKESDNPPAK